MLLIEFSTHTHIRSKWIYFNWIARLASLWWFCRAEPMRFRLLFVDICTSKQIYDTFVYKTSVIRAISNRINATEMRKLIIWLQITQTSRMWNYKRNARKSTVFTFGTIVTEILWEVEFFCWKTKTLVQNPNFFFAYGPQFDIVDFCVWKISFYNGSFYCALFYT